MSLIIAVYMTSLFCVMWFCRENISWREFFLYVVAVGLQVYVQLAS